MTQLTQQIEVSRLGRHSDGRGHAMRSLLIAGLVAIFASVINAADIEVVNTNDDGPGSLRVAIENADAGDRIVFNIPGGGTITLLSDLPEITDSLSFTNQNVAAVIIDRDTFGPLTVTGGVINLGETQFAVPPIGEDIILGPATTLIGDAEQITADITASGTVAPGNTNAAGQVGDLIINGELNATNSSIKVDLLGCV